jgi:hypothetical protein
MPRMGTPDSAPMRCTLVVIGLAKQIRQPRNVIGDHSRLVFREHPCGPVLPIDRIKLDAARAKRIFDSLRHFAPVGFGALVWWNSPYGYVDIV